jgi:hypothetical protein
MPFCWPKHSLLGAYKRIRDHYCLLPPSSSLFEVVEITMATLDSKQWVSWSCIQSLFLVSRQSMLFSKDLKTLNCIHTGDRLHKIWHGMAWHGISEFCHTNQIRTMYTQPIATRMHESDWCIAMPKQCVVTHDVLHPVRPRKRSKCTRPFPPFGSRFWGRD